MHLIHNSKNCQAATLTTSLSRSKIIMMNAQAHFQKVFSSMPPAIELSIVSLPHIFRKSKDHSMWVGDAPTGSSGLPSMTISYQSMVAKFGPMPKAFQNWWSSILVLLLPHQFKISQPLMRKYSASGSVMHCFLPGGGGTDAMAGIVADWCAVGEVVAGR